MMKYPFLAALSGRGGATWTGAPLSWLRVRSGKWIHDVTANVRKKKQP